MSLTHEDIKTILSIIDQAEGREIHVDYGDMTVIVRRNDGSGTAPPPPEVSARKPAAAPQAAAPAVSTAPAGAGEAAAPSPTAVPLKAPLTGIIYRAPSPEAPPFVEEGTSVGEEDTLCIIDVMKVMNLVKTPAVGTVARIDVENGESVQMGQILLWIEPA